MADLSRQAKQILANRLGWAAASSVITTLDASEALSATEVGYVDGITPGTAEASKAVILDSSSKIDTLDITAPKFDGKEIKLRHKTCAISSAPSGSEQDTEWDLPDSCAVLSVWLEVTTAEATGTGKTLDVGTLSTDSGDPNGFLAAVDCSSLGVVKGTLASGGQTLGALLRVDESGGGVLVPEMCVAPGSVSVTYTASDSDWVEFRGNIHILYVDMD